MAKLRKKILISKRRMANRRRKIEISKNRTAKRRRREKLVGIVNAPISAKPKFSL